MKLNRRVVTTSSTPSRVFRRTGPRSTSAPASMAARATDGQDKGAAKRAGAKQDGDDGARVKLRLGPDVPQLGAKGDGDGKAGEDQRRGAVQRLKDGKASIPARPWRSGQGWRRDRPRRSGPEGWPPPSSRQAPARAGQAGAGVEGLAIGSSRMARPVEPLTGHPEAKFGRGHGAARESGAIGGLET